MITPTSSFSSKLTTNFWLGELALYREERRFVAQHQIESALMLCRFLERVRSTFGGPVIITSGYRPPAVNRAVGGDVVSEHLYNRPGVGAVDFVLPAANMMEVERYCLEHWSESIGKGVARHGFIHLGMGWRVARGFRVWNY
jgi:uncharacterized protein YcbK (DUF882 family)